MLDDFTAIVHHLDGRTIKVWAVGDVHIGAKECDLDGFKSFLRRVSGDPDSYIVILGDLINNGIKSSISDYEDMSPARQVDVAAELLQTVADKILGCVGGNHERRSVKSVDLDPLYQIMCMLRANGESLAHLYRPNMAFIRIVLERGKTKDRYALMITHGKTANKKKQFTNIVEGVDACIYAHTHSPEIMIPGRIRFNEANKISVHDVISMTACSWLRAGGYGLAGLYLLQSVSRPQALELEFTNSNARNGNIRITW